jgi:hypothetical protein
VPRRMRSTAPLAGASRRRPAGWQCATPCPAGA